MNRMLVGCLAMMASSCVLAQPVVAQSFLQRLGSQLSQQLNPSQPAPAAADQPLPPPESTPTDATSRVALGIRVGPVTEEVIRAQRIAVRRGAVITAIEKGSAADRAGLPLGGVIVALDGRRIDHPEDLVQAIQAARPGQDVELTYYDQNKLARKKVHLAAVAPVGHTEFVRDPVLPPAAAPVPTPASPSHAPGLNLERELGGSGTRPLLGRLGRVLDSVTAPLPAPAPAGVAPAEGPLPAEPQDLQIEVAELRLQVLELTRAVESLRQQIAALESRVADKK